MPEINEMERYRWSRPPTALGREVELNSTMRIIDAINKALRMNRRVKSSPYRALSRVMWYASLPEVRSLMIHGVHIAGEDRKITDPKTIKTLVSRVHPELYDSIGEPQPIKSDLFIKVEHDQRRSICLRLEETACAGLAEQVRIFRETLGLSAPQPSEYSVQPPFLKVVNAYGPDEAIDQFVAELNTQPQPPVVFTSLHVLAPPK
jgi:hypothetical protein